MTELERKIANLERRVEDLESSGESKHFGSKHMGKKTKEVLMQEMKSLLNGMKPDTWTPKEANEFANEYLNIADEISQHADREWIASQLQEFKEKLQKVLELARH